MQISRRKKTPIVLQMEATECGAACFSMILGYYGRYVPLDVLRVELGISRNGCKASTIVQTARNYHMQAKGYRILLDDLLNFDGPLILYWGFNHYVVFEGCSKNHRYFYINDPASGPRTVDRETFENNYTGVALFLKPDAGFEKGGQKDSVIKIVLPMLKNTGAVMLSVIWSSFLLVIPGLAIPCIMKVFVDNIIPSEKSWMLPVVCLFVLMLVLQSVLRWIMDKALRQGKVQLSCSRTVGMFRYLLKMPIFFFLQRPSIDLQNRLSLNTSVAQLTFSTVTDNFVKFFVSLFFLLVMLIFSPALTLLISIFMIVNIACMLYMTKLRSVINQSVYMEQIKLMNLIVSGIDASDSLKSSGKELTLFSKWMDQLSVLNVKKLRLNVLIEYFSVIPEFFSLLCSMSMLCFGAWLIMKGELTLGGLFAFQTLSASFTAPFLSMIQTSSDIFTLKANISAINDVYSYRYDDYFKNDRIQRTELVKPYACIEFENVSFSYSKIDEPFIKNLSFKIPSGSRIAVVGASGSGKSTIAKLAAGLFVPTQGRLLLNGIPFQNYTFKEFYSMVGCVDQNVSLFSGTIKDNLNMFSNSIRQEKLLDALKDSCLFDELHERGSILSQEVKEGGTNYSGGQCQRLEIARVLAKDTPLVIFDEATSSLDPTTENMIDRMLRKKGITQLIIAHRLSTIKDADEIIVLEHGRIVQQGRHEELISIEGPYKALMSADGDIS
ncbi:MAG: cysteine peptidase family C39 domain-containing protein [Succinivibrio sp.]